MSPVWNTSPLKGFVDASVGFELDLNGMRLDSIGLQRLLEAEKSPKRESPPLPMCALAHQGMLDIEAGRIKNPDENRQVTHFTDRSGYLKSDLFRAVQAFAQEVRDGTVKGIGKPIEAVIINGIGGSALGPQLLQFAIHGPHWNELQTEERKRFPRIYFLDNTDAAGLSDVLAVIQPVSTLVVTISKSGKTQETRNTMRALEKAYAAADVPFASRAVGITCAGSELDQYAKSAGWLKVFPMAESIGGRTSETSIVGHVPAALTGIDFGQFVAGACHMDTLTRAADPCRNPAYQLAITWYVAGNGRGDRNMVVVPYADRLILLSRYLQQLVMESIGKERALDGRLVNQGLNVFGNKGGTDAHAYIQQLNDGRDDFFVTFIEILKDQVPATANCTEVAAGLTMGDYLHAFKQGLTNALTAKGRQVINVVLDDLTPFSMGMIVALYERAVAYYAELIGINAFHQPGVEAYKKASDAVNALNSRLQTWIASGPALPWTGTAADVAAAIGAPDAAADLEGILAKHAANGRVFGGDKVRVFRSRRDDHWEFSLKR